MATARVWTLLKDLATTDFKDLPPTERVTIRDEPGFFDGPVGARVAVLDFSPESGALGPGVASIPPAKEPQFFRYSATTAPSLDALQAPAFICESVFGTVHETIRMFEEPDILGRRVAWAFPGPQLLVVPRAGEWENAFYERDSRSLQFFYFPHRVTGQRVYTALSQDIVAHETTHAILDGIDPDLYNALSAESLAIHEAVADLGALAVSLRSRALQRRFLDTTGGDPSKWVAFAGLAAQFAEGTGRTTKFLRNLSNDLKMSDVDATEPHELSQVLSGALHALWRELFRGLKQRLRRKEPALDERSAAGRVVWLAREIYERMAFRALDCLPPGESTFADYARAILAADQSGVPEVDGPRAFLRKEFVRRGIAASEAALRVETDLDVPAVRRTDVEALATSDYAAYAFANKNRRLLGIPKDIPFKVMPRLQTEKLYYHLAKPKAPVRETLFKVSWTEEERQDVRGLPSVRQVVVGTTLSIDRDTKRVRFCLTTGRDGARRERREAYLRKLARQRALALGADAFDARGLARRDVIRAEVVEGTLRLRNTAHMLHVVGEV
ncbi:MAG: hypothetical protein Q7W02_08685 [Candidatus Rokubacteria bacterium]|nr:hypothetical protein [Candidatus Rokubacteria bacterium]